jgi:hypothetical protein
MKRIDFNEGVQVVQGVWKNNAGVRPRPRAYVGARERVLEGFFCFLEITLDHLDHLNNFNTLRSF